MNSIFTSLKIRKSDTTLKLTLVNVLGVIWQVTKKVMNLTNGLPKRVEDSKGMGAIL